VIYKMVGAHAEDLADGRVLAVGEEVDLSKEEIKDPHNQRLVEEGKLIEGIQPESSKTPSGGRASSGEGD
jgi:hypothetical protein